MNRRFLLLSTLCALLPARWSHASEPVTVVLAHGAWVGDWYWAPLRAELRARGLSSLAPDLDARAPGTGVENLARTLAETIETAKGPVILVGHSAGVRVATAAWDQARASVRAVVLIEGPLPLASPPEVIPPDTRSLQYLVVNAPGIVDTGVWPPPEALRLRYGDRSRGQSLSSLTGAVTLRNGPLPDDIPRHAVSMSASPLAGLARQAIGRPGWSHTTLEGDHDVVGSAAGALADLVADIASDLDQR